MYKKLSITIITSLMLSVFAPMLGVGSGHIVQAQDAEQESSETIIAIQMKGSSSYEKRFIPMTFTENGQMILQSDCFDVDLIDISTGDIIGNGTDCLNPLGGDPVNGIKMLGTTILNLPGGTIVTRGLTTVQPTTHGSPDSTHITGALSGEDNDILYGTHAYKGAKGTVRLSGAVNMSKLGSDGEVTFNCIFVLTLEGDYPNPTSEDGPVMVLNLIGTDTVEYRDIPTLEHNGETYTEGECFDVDLVNVLTGESVGNATDCLNPVGGDPMSGLQIIGTTIFNFEQEDGSMETLVSRGLTSVQPVTHGSPDSTHVTGSIPPVEGSNDILSGTGQFEGAEGSVRLSGLVNMSKLDSDSEISFNCLFVVYLN